MESAILSKAKTKMNSLLICPLCKQKQITISDLTSQGKIYYQCECSNFRFEDSISSFISKIDSIKTEENICFKHKDQIAQIFCKDCNYYMCKLCDSFHSSFQPTHKPTLLSNGFSSNCIQHIANSKEIICLTCNYDICSQCHKESHLKHKIIHLKDLYANFSDSLPFKSIDEYTKHYSEKFNEIDTAYQKQLDTLQMIHEHLDTIKQEIKEGYYQMLENNTNSIILMGILYLNYFRNKECPNSTSLLNIIKVNLESISSSNDNSSNKLSINQQPNYTQYNYTPAYSYGNPPGIVRPTIGPYNQLNKGNSLNKIEEINKHLLAFKDESLNYFKQNKLEIRSNKLSFPLRSRILYSKKYNTKFQMKTNSIQRVIDIYTHPKKISLMIELTHKRLAINSDDHTIIILGQNDFNQFEIINKNLCHQHGVITALCLLQNGNLISGTSNASYGNKNTIDPIREWNMTTFECVKIISTIQNKIAAIAQVSSQLLAVAIVSTEIQIVDLVSGQITKTLSSGLTNGKILTMLSNGDLVSVSLYDKRKQVISILNIESGKIAKAIEKNSISVLKEMPNNRLMYNEGNKIIIYNLSNSIEEKILAITFTGNELNPPNQLGGVHPVNYGFAARANEPAFNDICSVCFLSSNRIIVGYSLSYMEIWDIEQDQKETTMVFWQAKLGLITHFGDHNIAFMKNNTISLIQI